MSTASGNNGGGPCGACKFLRRKCVKGCIFAPYFDSDQGAVCFAAVHKVFGASNASKMLLSISAHKRLDAVVSLCYEALARVRDPVYGCVGHLFTLQQQVVNMQAELAYIQARLSTLQFHSQLQSSSSTTNAHSSSDLAAPAPDYQWANFDPSTSMELASFFSSNDQEIDDSSNLHAYAREFMLPGTGMKLQPASPH